MNARSATCLSAKFGVMPIDQSPPVGPQIRIRQYREALRITVADLVIRIAELGVDVHPDTIRNVELGRRRASPSLMTAWCQALGLAPMDAWQPDRSSRACSASTEARDVALH